MNEKDFDKLLADIEGALGKGEKKETVGVASLSAQSTITGNKGKLTEKEAGYMELEGAKKDGDCHIVHVENGISKDLGCCNLFRYSPGKEKKFSCGTCSYESAN